MKTPVLVSTLLIMTMTLTSFKQNQVTVQETRKLPLKNSFALRVISAFPTQFFFGVRGVISFTERLPRPHG